MILPLLREASGSRELIAVWAERSATGCRLNAGDDGLRRGCSLQAFGELCRSCAVQATKCQYTESELYPLGSPQPMQVMEKQNDVIRLSRRRLFVYVAVLCV